MKMMIKQMKHLSLFEKFTVNTDPGRIAALERLMSVGSPQNVTDYLMIIVNWFRGSMMGDTSNMPEVINALRRIGEVYEDEIRDRSLYRTAHLYLDQAGMTAEDIRKISTGAVGPRLLQSWSAQKAGAEWFFNHFVKEQNRRDGARADASWVIVKAHSENLDVLITYDECMQFMADCADAYDYIQHIIGSDVKSSDLKNKMLSLYDPEMLNLHEVICVVPENLRFDVVDVKVPPKEGAPDAPDYQDLSDRDIRRLFSLFAKLRQR